LTSFSAVVHHYLGKLRNAPLKTRRVFIGGGLIVTRTVLTSLAKGGSGRVRLAPSGEGRRALLSGQGHRSHLVDPAKQKQISLGTPKSFKMITLKAAENKYFKPL
jgi:hypothetical protein